MFHCPVGVWVIEQRAIILSATVRSPTVVLQCNWLAQVAKIPKQIWYLIDLNPGARFKNNCNVRV